VFDVYLKELGSHYGDSCYSTTKEMHSHTHCGSFPGKCELASCPSFC